ncbi:hypothetical protein [Burkholderia gladioli]|uniref:hypothetical protein n=1 Tax=Burkholderia gladioli TaxID=28095 RepID=UPI001641B6F5|nr:hypothetical protein [Burkholderia gladioli]
MSDISVYEKAFLYEWIREHCAVQLPQPLEMRGPFGMTREVMTVRGREMDSTLFAAATQMLAQKVEDLTRDGEDGK